MDSHIVVRTRDDIIDYVNARPSQPKILLLVTIALGGIFIDAYDLVVLGTATEQLTEQFGLSPFHLSMIMTAMPFGALIGALVGGIYTDKFGRKLLFTIDLILLVVATIGAALAPNATVLLIFRFLMGIGIGLDMPVALSFISELSNTKTKGRNVNYWQVFWYIATVTTAFIVIAVYALGAGDDAWRWSVGLGAVFAVIILILRFMYLKESPMWAAKNSSLNDAAKTLEKTYNISVRIEDDGGSDRPEEAQNPTKLPLGIIFNKRYGRRTILAMVIAATQGMEYYAIGLYIPVLLTTILNGGRLETLGGTAVINVFGILGGLAGAHLSARFGMRRLAIMGYIIVIFSMAFIGLLSGAVSIWLIAGVIGLFIFGHSSGPGPQGKSIGALSYPTILRGYGTGAVEAASRVGGMFGTFFFPVLLAAFGLDGTMLFLILAPAVGLVAALIIKWDPTNKGPEIEAEHDDVIKEIERSGVVSAISESRRPPFQTSSKN
ncbi:MFS transporter [Arthrobacter castelli]|uniref:MFS transporter n=1 Tax=Arthrobacter castelli TaxID=271431 RepID=UPI0009D769D9|nr:MFS transporter [Arthrobacter castelli]